MRSVNHCNLEGPEAALARPADGDTDPGDDGLPFAKRDFMSLKRTKWTAFRLASSVAASLVDFARPGFANMRTRFLSFTRLHT